MTTPTCNTCGAKFPGREKCKTCGADPNGKVDIDAKMRMLTKTLPSTKQLVAVNEAIRSATNAMVQTLQPQLKAFREMFGAVDLEEMRKFERRVLKAKERSMRSTQRHARHGTHRG